MDIVSQLLVAALFSLHQYIPSDSGHKYFEYSVDPVTLQAEYNGLDILAAAHGTCRHFFKSGGEELDFSEQELFNFASILVEQNNNNLVEIGSSTNQAKEILRRVCQPVFDPQSFSREETRAIERFIKEKISVLTRGDLDSTGSYRFFGPVELFDRNGNPLGPISNNVERWVAYDEISPLVSHALIAAEDEHFLKHEGVYLGSLVRMAYNMKSSDSGNITGGSTLTMQLLKNMYFNSWPETDPLFLKKPKFRTVLRKIREWYWAKVYEKHHERLGPGSGKRYVLEQYLNLMDFAPNVVGITQAAKTFFGKTPAELNLADAAFIATLFKGPSRYSRPANYEKFTLPRKNYVLSQMQGLDYYKHGLDPIDEAQKSSALAEALPQWTSPTATEAQQSPSEIYLRNYARDFISREINLPEGVRAIEGQLVTTIDKDLQRIVFETVQKRLDDYDRDRRKVRRVKAALDDRSEVAIASEDDFNQDLKSNLSEFQYKLEQLGANLYTFVFLGDRGGRDASKKLYSMVGAQKSLPLTSEIERQLYSSLDKSSRFVGQVLVAEVDSQCLDNSLGTNFKSLQQVLAEGVPYKGEGSEETDETEASSSSILEVPAVEGASPSVETIGTEAQKADPNGFPPLPRPRPKNADEIIAKAKQMQITHMFASLPIEERQAVSVPYALPQTGACVRLVSSTELGVVHLAQTHERVEEMAGITILQNLAARIEATAPREDMFAAVFDGRAGKSQAPLVVIPRNIPDDSQTAYSQWVRPAPLATSYRSENHARHLSRGIDRGEFRVGQVFWVSPVENKNTFSLVPPKLQSAVIVMDSETGEVLANYGGYLPKSSKFFDRSRLSVRQPGSTLKPWLYFLALTKFFEPHTMIQNEGVVFNAPGYQPYEPENFSRGTAGSLISMEQAFITSQNKPAVGLLTNTRFGPSPLENLKEFINLLTDIRIYRPESVQVIPSTALGSQGLKILDLVSSFTFFANGTHIVRPTFFRSLKSGGGEQLYQSSKEAYHVPHAHDRKAVFQIQSMLLRVANAGTASRLAGLPRSLGLRNCGDQQFGMGGQLCFGGKTGTSNDSKDNWFIGFSRRFVIGVWVGYDFPESTGSTGGALALPIFEDIVKNGKDYLPPVEPIISEVPAGLSLVRVNSTGSCRTSDGSGRAVYSSTMALELPVCMRCSCVVDNFFGQYWGYSLIVNGLNYGNFSSGFGDQQDLNQCQSAARSMGCQ